MGRLGQPVPHDSAREHVRGEAAYVADLPPLHGELCVDFVGSPVAHGRITSIDVDAAKQVKGVAAVLTWADVPGDNTFGPVFHDEELLAREVVHYVGQPVVAVAGESREAVAATPLYATAARRMTPPDSRTRTAAPNVAMSRSNRRDTLYSRSRSPAAGSGRDRSAINSSAARSFCL